jgi:CelD/BcsL family acetyltransferase involved in cellulose biosynthesis
MALENTHEGFRTRTGRSHHDNLHTITVYDFESLRSHTDAWDRLAADVPQKNPYLLPGWIDAAFRHALGPDERWLCCFAYIGDRLVGVLPVIARPHPLLGQDYPLLRTFDKHAQSGEALLAPDHAVSAFRALLSEVNRQIPKHLSLDMKAVRPSSPLWEAIEGGVGGYVIRCGRHHSFSFLNVEGDFDAYMATLGNMRGNVKRYRKKLESRGKVSFEIKKSHDAKEDFLAEFLSLEASGWKGRNGTAIANRPDSVLFYSALVANFAAQGHLEWHTIRVENDLVAAELGVRFGSALFLPKTAYNEEFADCRPGNILNAEVTRQAFLCPELIEINDMSDMEWHALWRMSRDKYVDVHLVRRGVLPFVFRFSRVTLTSVYQHFVRPRIPVRLRKAWHQVRRPPRKAAKAS